MQITVEYLATIRQQAEQQKLRLLAEAQQVAGAIALIDALALRLNAPDEQHKEGLS